MQQRPLRANLLVTYVLGRWHRYRYARSGFTKSPPSTPQLILR